MSKRSYELARRLELGALALEAFASSLTEFEWQSRVPGDGRKIGVVVHHVASVYPVEIGLAQVVDPAAIARDLDASLPDGLDVLEVVVSRGGSLAERLEGSSWEITLASSGLPVAIRPSATSVSRPQVSWVKDEGIPHVYHSRGYISGSGATGTLTASGTRFIELLTGDFEAPAPVAASTPKVTTKSKSKSTSKSKTKKK